MAQPARPDTVYARFDAALPSAGAPYQLGRTDDTFYVDFGAGEPRHPIALVTGSHHMQIYWYETGHDRSLGQLPHVFLRSEQRWVPRDAIFLEPPAPLQPAAAGRWNASCIACHTTLGQPRIDAAGVFTAVRYLAEHSARARGLDARALAYDFLTSPTERASVADPVARRLQPTAANEDRVRVHAELARWLAERDDHPMRLLE